MKVQTFEPARERVARLMSSRDEVLAAYIFGSLATGRARPDSDIDIAVLVDRTLIRGDLFDYRLRLMADLRDVLERPDVEVVLLNQAPPVLAQNVIAKGRVLFERSRSARIRFSNSNPKSVSGYATHAGPSPEVSETPLSQWVSNGRSEYRSWPHRKNPSMPYALTRTCRNVRSEEARP